MSNENDMDLGVISRQEKLDIADQLRSFVEMAGSANKAEKMLRGVSSAYISHALSEDDAKWKMMSDDAWRNIRSQVGGSYDGDWNVVSIQNMELMQGFIADSRLYATTYGIVSEAGFGKTCGALEDCNVSRNTFLLKCKQHWNRKYFLLKLMQAMGLDDRGLNIQDMMELIVGSIMKLEHPVIIIDEFDKLTDSLKYFFISLYNDLEGFCGLIVMGAPNLKKGIEAGAKRDKKGYKEILSRVGGKFIRLPEPTKRDIRTVIRANGVLEKSEVTNILNRSNNDLRVVKKLVHAHHRKTMMYKFNKEREEVANV